MNRQNLLAAGALFVVALLIAVAFYVSNLQAADAPPPKLPATPAEADQIKKLQARIESLEKRLATLENSRTNTWDIIPINPPSPPGLKFIPAPPPKEPERDGFPKARIIFIDGKQQATNGNPAP